MPDLLPNIRPGDPISAQLLNTLINRNQFPITARGSGGIGVRSTDGQIQVYSDPTGMVSVRKGKVAAGGITARASDTVHGTGNVELWDKDPSTGHYADTGESVSVDSISSTTGGVAAGVWVNVMSRNDGGWELVSVDCGN